jgi:enoyl-CoA hydratase/carnithine racemase
MANLLSQDVDTSKVLSAREGQNLIITLNRPEKRNALNGDLLYGIKAAFEDIYTNPEVRTIIVRGEGPVFSAGVDFAALAESPLFSNDHQATRNLIREMQEIFNYIEDIEKPVIFALHGFCFGMATEMVLAGDFRIASEGTKIGINEVAVGLIPDCGGIARLTKLIGPIKAKEMIMTAKMIDANEAKEIQLFNDVVKDEMEEALKLADMLNKNAPLAVGMAKKIINRGEHMDVRSLLELEAIGQTTLVNTEDVKEGLSAKLERREARFTGK